MTVIHDVDTFNATLRSQMGAPSFVIKTIGVITSFQMVILGLRVVNVTVNWLTVVSENLNVN